MDGIHPYGLKLGLSGHLWTGNIRVSIYPGMWLFRAGIYLSPGLGLHWG